MVEQFSGRRGQGHSGALIHHRKSLIGKDFVDWTRDTAGVARLRREAQITIQSDSQDL
jgi:hypothetical protein